MTFVRYTPDYGPKRGCWVSRNDIGLVSLMYEQDKNTLHIHFASNIKNEQNISPQYRGQIFVHVTSNGIEAEGYRARFDENGKFAGKDPTDASALAEFELDGLPRRIKILYRKALEFRDEIRMSSSSKR